MTGVAQQEHETPMPARSLVQRLAALDTANEIRSRRAVLKKELKHGQESVVKLLDDPPEWLDTMKVWDLLMAVPKYGRVKVNRLLVANRISPSKTVGGLSERQNTELLLALRVHVR